MALVRSPGGHPTLAHVAVVLSDPRVGLGGVTAKQVFDACCARRIIVSQSRMDSKRLSDVYFELTYARGISERPSMNARERAMDVFGSSAAMEGNEAAMEAALDDYRDEIAAALANDWSPGPWMGNHRVVVEAADFVRRLP